MKSKKITKEEVVARLDELGMVREARCPFCNIGIDGPTDYDCQCQCACGAQYRAESVFDIAESCWEWVVEGGVSGEFFVVRGFDFITDDELSLPEDYDEWVLIFARPAHQKSVVTMVWQVIPSQASAMQALALCIRNGWRWEVDYSQVTKEKKDAWWRADIACRAMLAKQEGRPVHFDDCEYLNLQEWEDAISLSGQISIDCDDETGLWVKSVGPEPTKH